MSIQDTHKDTQDIHIHNGNKDRKIHQGGKYRSIMTSIHRSFFFKGSPLSVCNGDIFMVNVYPVTGTAAIISSYIVGLYLSLVMELVYANILLFFFVSQLIASIGEQLNPDYPFFGSLSILAGILVAYILELGTLGIVPILILYLGSQAGAYNTE